MTIVTQFEMNARYFRHQTIFRPLPEPEVSKIYSRDPPVPLSSLTQKYSPREHFHFVDTVAYNLAMPAFAEEEAFEIVWKTWYPRRKMEKHWDGNYNAFFCRVLRPHLSVRQTISMSQTLEFHEAFLQALDMDAEDSWKFTDTLRRIFIVFHKYDEDTHLERGVLVFCRSDSLGVHGLNPASSEGSYNQNGWVAFQMPLEDAVKVVICDLERRKALAPTVEEYREKKFAI